MPRSTRALTALSILALTSMLAAQAVPPQIVPVHTAESWRGADYGTWAAGATYKASFHDGMTFVPYLGADYPHNQPFSWHTESVTIGDVELATRTTAAACDERRVEYDLGAVIEAYDVLAHGLEQTFVIRSKPADGDLVVRGTIATMLHSNELHEQHRELHFRDAAGAHLITYGRATAIDANGRQRAMTTSFVDGVITLRLDDAWLRTATFPLVVDPLIGPGSQLPSNSINSVDIISDSTSAPAPDWVTYSYSASIFDRDLRCALFEADMSTNYAVFADLTTQWSSSAGRGGIVPAANAALIVFERRDSNAQLIELRLHDHSRNDLSLKTTSVAVPASGFPSRPVIGGADNTYSGDKAMLVWQSDPTYSGGTSSIRASVYDATNDTFGAETTIADGALVDHERPSINHNRRFTSAGWLVAYQARTTVAIGTNNDDWDIAVVKIDDANNVTGPIWIDDGNGDHKFAPKIDGVFEQYAVSYVTEPVVPGSPPTDDAGDRAMVVRIDWPTATPIGTVPYAPRIDYQAAQPDSVRVGGIAIDVQTTDHWAITYHDSNTGGFFVNRIGFRGGYLGQDTITTGGVSVAGSISFDVARQEWALAYANNSSLFSGHALVNRLVRPNAPPPVVSGTSCSTASIGWNGTQLIGDQTTRVEVSNAPSNAIHTMGLSLTPVSAPLNVPGLFVPGCNLLISPAPQDFYGLLSLEVGNSASWPLAILEFLPDGTVLYFQGFHTDGTSLEFVTTQRLEVTVVK